MSSITDFRMVGMDIDRRARAALAPHHMTLPQYTILSAVADTPGMSSASTARATGVTPQTAWITVGNLIGHGWVVRMDHEPGTGRGIRLKTTAKGRTALRKARAALADVEDYVADILGHPGTAAVTNARTVMGQRA